MEVSGFHKTSTKIIKRMIYLLLRAILDILMLVLSPLESYLINNANNKISALSPPIFIIGAPRTGSTIIYQILTNNWDVGYINNLECYFYKTLTLFSFLSKRVFGDKKHNSFFSKHGTTKGLNSPSECGELWNRWFPRDRDFVDANELTEEQNKEMKRVISSVMYIKNKPLVFKNMNCGQRIRALSRSFPNALFLYCKRDPLYTAQDIIQVRERIYGNRATWWSIKPKEFSVLENLSPLEQVVSQVFYIEEQIDNDLDRFFKKQQIIIDYEDFCNNPQKTIEDIKLFLGSHGVTIHDKSQDSLDFIQNDNRKYINDDAFNQLEVLVQKYFKGL